MQQLTTYLKERSAAGEEESCFKTKSLLGRLKMLAKSLEKFLTQIKEDVAYEDILGSYVVGLNQVPSFIFTLVILQELRNTICARCHSYILTLLSSVHFIQPTSNLPMTNKQPSVHTK